MSKLGRFIGYVEDWLPYNEHREVRGQFYNGIRTYYFLFIPVWRSGFNHSTTFFPD